MVYLAACDSPFSLAELAAQIHKSSNFRFNWQFYEYSGIDPQSPLSIRRVLETIIADPALHSFLRESFQPIDSETFEIDLLHEHCRVQATDEFENILARARDDHLGAYSPHLPDATAEEKQQIKRLFDCVGEYHAYELLPGTVASCPACHVHNNHLFSSWFYGVAWDWCFLVVWPRRNLLWVGCLTDTD